MLDKLADLYDQYFGPPGIPWSGLIAQGHGIDENGGYDDAYMQLMLQESFKYFAVLGKMTPSFKYKYKNIRDTEARKAVTQTMALMDQTGTDIWQAVKEADWSAMFHFPRTVAEDALATFAASATNSAYLHFDGVIEAALRAGTITPDEAMAHANSVMKTFQTFISLDKEGHLDDLKTPAPVAGMGVAPAAAAPIAAGWALAALGIVLILGICYIIYVWKIASPVQAKLFEWCDKLNADPNASPEDLRSCVTAAANIAEHGNGGLGDFLGGLVKPLGVVLAVGAGIWVASMVLPGLLARKAVAS